MTPPHFLAAGRRPAFCASTELGTALSPSKGRPAVRGAAALFALLVTLMFPEEARASFLSPELEDKLATFLALFIIFVVPVVLIALFWMVHVLPEKIAHKRHHPQRDAITTLCLLSLVFGGLLWPLAWIWAYTKPIGYRLAYGTDRHPEYYDEMAEKHREGRLSREEVAHLREELEAMEARGALPPGLRALKDELVRPKIAEKPVRNQAV